jgi:glutamate-5-semialdehyde dehydrogenase
MGIENEVLRLAQAARNASRAMARLLGAVKDNALRAMSGALLRDVTYILGENQKDVELAKKEKLSPAFIDRLTLNEKRIEAMANSLIEIANLRDPVGEVSKMWVRPNGLRIGKLRVPLGVVGIIYESRPNVTSDCIGLTLKSGNCVILRGGREAINSNIAIHNVMDGAATGAGIPSGAIGLTRSTDRKVVEFMLGLHQYIDLIIPRGGESLIREVSEKSRIPVLKHYKGLCHIYVDEDADFEMAQKIIHNAKVQRPGVCNAVETVLVHRGIAGKFLPLLINALREAKVEIRGCSAAKAIVGDVKDATEEDWETEYLDLIISIKVVGTFEEAVAHIEKYSSGLSEAIITRNYNRAMEFLQAVDSACVYVNASTRFTDGNQFGMGAEMGISTDKLHARGPVGVEELTTYKYIIFGNGQIRE